MSLLFAIIFWALCAVLVFLVVLLITPMRFRLHLANTPQLAYRLDVRVAGGLAPSITLVQGPHRKQKSARRAKKKSPKKHGKSRVSPFRGSARSALPRLIADIFDHIHLSELVVDADFGLNDPADTGQLSGLLMPLQYAHPQPHKVSLNLRPDFTQSGLRGTLTAGIQVTLAAFLIPIMRFGWHAFGPAG